MKATVLMSIKQLAELLGVSTDTVRRAARSGLIPSTREGAAYRFDFRKVRQAMERRANETRTRRSIQASAPGGESRPRAVPSPPMGNTGALPTQTLTGVRGVL
jgi:excisionase family DNA binding protein